jgi:hypothetical protein
MNRELGDYIVEMGYGYPPEISGRDDTALPQQTQKIARIAMVPRPFRKSGSTDAEPMKTRRDNMNDNKSKANEEQDVLEFTGRGGADFWFACVDLAVLKDPVLSVCDKAVFLVICGHVDVQTRSCPLRIKTIAEETGRSVRSVQESLKALVERGVIERVERFENGQQQASVYTIVGHHAPCYKDTKSAPPTEPAPAYESCTPEGAENDPPSLREPKIYEIQETSPAEREINLPTATAGIAANGQIGQNLKKSRLKPVKASTAPKEPQDCSPLITDHVEQAKQSKNGRRRVSACTITKHRAPCCRGTKSAPPAESAANRGAKFAPISKSFTPVGEENVPPSLRESKIYEIKETSPAEREINLPTAVAGIAANGQIGQNLKKSHLKPVKASTAPKEPLDLSPLITARARITPDGLSALCRLEKIRTPQRVGKENTGAAERFRLHGESLSEPTPIYIYNSLRQQNAIKYVKDKAPLKQEIYKEYSTDPCEGGYL